VVREVRCKVRLNVSNVLDSMIAAGNSLQTVAAEKLKKRPLKLVVHEGIYIKDSEWLSKDGVMVGTCVVGF